MLTLKAGLKLRSKFGNFVNKISLWKRQILSVSLILVELSKIPLKILLIASKIRLSSITDQKSNTMPKTTSCNGNVCHPQTILISCTKNTEVDHGNSNYGENLGIFAPNRVFHPRPTLSAHQIECSQNTEQTQKQSKALKLKRRIK